MCSKHYFRKYRGRPLELKDSAERRYHSKGYILVPAAGHPLASNGYAYEHRKIFYDAHPAGPFACHYCDDELVWDPEPSGANGVLISHLDGDKTNNNLSNLAPTCSICSRARSRHSGVFARALPFRVSAD
ncbi:MAG: hypothetical protein K0R27_908 [Xanthobacteraceae bacterium]|jgi:uncharacterized Zn-finger protein|nr:hypothetical protein [Xanthobacteraceae bacterium]